MTPLASRSIRARRRPGAIALLWGFRLLGAWLVAAPLADLLTSGVSSLERGDAVLFEPGGAYLLEVLRLGLPQLAAGARRAMWAALLVACATLVPLCALMVALANAGRLRLGEWSQKTAPHLPAFVLLAGLTLLVQAAVAITVGLSVLAAREPLQAQLSAPTADLSLVALMGVGLIVILLLGITQDLARAAAVRHQAKAREAVLLGLRAATARPLRVLIDWLMPAVWSLAVVLGAAIVVGYLHVEWPGDWRLYAVLLVHQLAALSLVALRATWLARALAILDSPAAAGSERMP